MSAAVASNDIVVGVDGSTSSMVAVEWAARDAALRGRNLILVHAQADATAGTWLDAPIAEAFLAERQERGHMLLDDAEAAARKAVDPARDISISQHLVVGAAVPVLADMSTGAAILVLGSRGLGTVASLLLGSVSAGVLHRAQCPVAVIHAETGARKADAPVVVGVDGSPVSAAAVAVALEEASWRGVDLVAVHACSDDDEELPGIPWAELENRGTEVIAEQLAGWRERYPDVEVREVVARTSPARWIVEQGDKAQLVVVGSRGRGGFAGAMLGSVSRAVVEASECPVLVVRNSL